MRSWSAVQTFVDARRFESVLLGRISMLYESRWTSCLVRVYVAAGYGSI